MEKIWVLVLVILLASTVRGASAEQKVFVNVVPGFLDFLSPHSGTYQENNILTSVGVETGGLKVKDIILFDNAEKNFLCSNCNDYSKELYYNEGMHNLNVQVIFESGDVLEGNVSFFVDSLSDIYINNGGLRRASANDLIKYLFDYNFTIIHRDEFAPEDSCSVRAKAGSIVINNVSYENGKLNFYSVSSLKQGQGSFTAQKNRKFVSFKFNVMNVTENSQENLFLDVRDKKTKKDLVLTYNKISGMVSIYGQGVSISNMQVSFSEGCEIQKSNFYFLQKNSRTSRSIEEVRKILLENPIFINQHQNLNFLFTDNWRLKKVLGVD